MSGQKEFQIPLRIERYLAALSKLYANERLTQLQEIIVNSKIRVHEEWTSDNWNGGRYGHALYLILPEILYLTIVKQKEKLQDQIGGDLNKIHNIHDEFIEEVFFEMEIVEDGDWRKASGLLLNNKRPILPEIVSRVWEKGKFKLFLSHKTEVKKETAKLKEELEEFGMSCFVAHEDIEPTREWQNEIEHALDSMDGLIALLTEGFHDSLWTDQELGFAFGRGVPIISVRLGRDPYGFIGKFQGLAATWDTAAKEIVSLLIKSDKMLDAYIHAIVTCKDFNHANRIAKLLEPIKKISNQQVSELLSAYIDNPSIHRSYGFNGEKPFYYGKGLAFHLRRLTGKDYSAQLNGGEF